LLNECWSEQNILDRLVKFNKMFYCSKDYGLY